MNEDKLKIIRDIMKEMGVKTWILYSDENSDYIFENYICDKTIVKSCAIITPDDIFLIVHDLEIDNIDCSLYKVFAFNSNVSMEDVIEEIITKYIHFPDEIFLNYSTQNDIQTDLIGHGIYVYITKLLCNIYSKVNKIVKFNSAEDIIYSLLARKSNKTVERMKNAADITVDILEKSFHKLKEGYTELDIVEIVHSIFEEVKNEIINENIIEMTYAWKEEFCPIVLVGPSLKKGGHALASKQQLKKGHTIYFDFGVTLKYADNEKVSSDLQRMGYLKKENEINPPDEVLNVFNTLILSINAGVQAIKPGLKGYQIDKVVRDVILENKYPDYDHATGHPIGEKAHNPGTVLGKKTSKNSKMEIQKYGVYTIEPRIAIDNGGSIEEMVYVTDKEGIFLSRRQTSLYLI